jgi:excisionase family DNA binding protein
MLSQAEQLLTIEETAARLRQSPATVRRKIREGQLPAIRVGSGPRAPFRVNPVELEQWLYAEGTP